MRRYEFTNFDGLAVLTAEYERVISTLGEDLAPPSPEKSLIPENAYKRWGIQSKQNSSVAAIVSTLADSDTTQNTTKLAQLIKVLIRDKHFDQLLVPVFNFLLSYNRK